MQQEKKRLVSHSTKKKTLMAEDTVINMVYFYLDFNDVN
jgi:hypothetical protein